MMMIMMIGGTYFEEYGALMKAWNNDWRPDRWYDDTWVMGDSDDWLYHISKIRILIDRLSSRIR